MRETPLWSLYGTSAVGGSGRSRSWRKRSRPTSGRLRFSRVVTRTWPCSLVTNCTYTLVFTACTPHRTPSQPMEAKKMKDKNRSLIIERRKVGDRGVGTRLASPFYRGAGANASAEQVELWQEEKTRYFEREIGESDGQSLSSCRLQYQPQRARGYQKKQQCKRLW